MDDFDNEIKPACLLGLYSKKELGITIQITDNQDDPPDYFAIINNSKEINLELTHLAPSYLHKDNSLLDTFGEIIEEKFEEKKSKMSPGKYLVTYELGKTITYSNNKWKSTELCNEDQISKNHYEKQIDSSVHKLIKKCKGNNVSSEIKNRNGRQVGIIHLFHMEYSDIPKIHIYRNRCHNLNLSSSFILNQFQKIINNKENKYTKKPLINSKDWWLLIHDLKNYLNTDLFINKLDDRLFDYSFFTKVLFIRKSYPSYKISILQNL